MNRQPFEKPPRWWGPKLSPAWIRFWRPWRRRVQLKKQRLLEVEVRGLEHVQNAVDQGHGVLITPNHSAHADAYSMYEVSDRVGRPFYFMATWHMFTARTVIGRRILQWHGVFSVDREGTDLQAFTRNGYYGEYKDPKSPAPARGGPSIKPRHQE